MISRMSNISKAQERSGVFSFLEDGSAQEARSYHDM
jgi:hypothetical protein